MNDDVDDAQPTNTSKKMYSNDVLQTASCTALLSSCSIDLSSTFYTSILIAVHIYYDYFPWILL